MTLGRGKLLRFVSLTPPGASGGNSPGVILRRIARILNHEQGVHINKVKDLRKKIRRLEKRLREGSQKLAELKRSLEAAEAVKALKATRKSFARAAAARIAEASKLAAKKAKRKLNLSPERRAQLAAAMKARWAAKRAAGANAVKPSPQLPTLPRL
jgi:hypothetical protein